MSASSSEPPVSDEQVQEDLMRLEAYRNQLQAVVQQHEILSNSRTEHLRARESLEGVDRAASGTEFVLPLGGETFVRGSVVKEAPVMLGIGSGVVVEMDRAKAMELLAERTAKIGQAIRDLEGQAASIDERIQLLSRRLDAVSRGGGGASRVGGT
ncbi:MAG TPA: prefoldin subunit alpha [Thermoplasmata archaeon]|nr:prefoldin subunit alpha [Thermoplasmata archaeon]